MSIGFIWCYLVFTGYLWRYCRCWVLPLDVNKGILCMINIQTGSTHWCCMSLMSSKLNFCCSPACNHWLLWQNCIFSWRNCIRVWTSLRDNEKCVLVIRWLKMSSTKITNIQKANASICFIPIQTEEGGGGGAFDSTHSILNYIRIWRCKHMFSTNFKKLAAFLLKIKFFEKSKMAVNMADLLWNDCCHRNIS